MILSLVAIATLGQADVKAVLSRSLSTHRALKSSSVVVTTQTRMGGKRKVGKYEIAFIKPERLSIRVVEPGADRKYFFVGRTAHGVDRRYNEYLRRPLPPYTTLLEKSALLFKGLDDAVQTLLDVDVMSGLYDRLLMAQGWKPTSKFGLVGFEMNAGSGKTKSGATIRFDRKSFLLKEVQLTSLGSTITWTYDYSAAPKSISFTKPAGYIEVESFLERGPSATYLDPGAKQKAEACARAYDSLRHVELTTRNGSESSRIWFSNHRLREKQSRIDWSYGDGTLWLEDAKLKRLYKGKVSYGSVPKYLAKFGVRMDPLIRQLITRNNPIRKLLDSTAKVRSKGMLSSGGEAYDLLEVSRPELKAVLWIRSKDKLIGRIDSNNLDARGNVILTSRRDIEYVRVGSPLPASLFRYAGRPRPLSQIKK